MYNEYNYRNHPITVGGFRAFHKMNEDELISDNLSSFDWLEKYDNLRYATLKAIAQENGITIKDDYSWTDEEKKVVREIPDEKPLGEDVAKKFWAFRKFVYTHNHTTYVTPD
jgi:hypothetical protein